MQYVDKYLTTFISEMKFKLLESLINEELRIKNEEFCGMRKMKLTV